MQFRELTARTMVTLMVPAGAALTGPMENQLTLPCGRVVKFWTSVELVHDPENPEADPRDLTSAEMAEIGLQGMEYNEPADLALGEVENA